MSLQATRTPPSVAAASEALLRRTVLNAARDRYRLSDHIDLIDQALIIGDIESARLIGEMTIIRIGFAPEQASHRAVLKERIGLLSADDEPIDAPNLQSETLPTFSVDRAIAELTRLITYTPELPSLPTQPDMIDLGRASDFVVTTRDAITDVAQTCTMLRHALIAPDPAMLVALLDRLQAIAAHPTIDLSGNVSAETRDLIEVFVSASLQEFLRETLDIAAPPFGSPRLFHASARSSPTGLGAYGKNVGNVVRNGRDILAMIQLSGKRAGLVVTSDLLERWAVLLAAQLGGYIQCDLVDELGDMGLLRALRGLFGRVARTAPSHGERAVLWRLRDAALDDGDYTLASHAQTLIAAMAPGDFAESAVLGEIEATRGDTTAADRAFGQALSIDPNNGAILTRLAALRAGKFGKFLLKGGFGTPPSRQALRRVRGRPGEHDS